MLSYSLVEMRIVKMRWIGAKCLAYEWSLARQDDGVVEDSLAFSEKLGHSPDRGRVVVQQEFASWLWTV